MKKIIKINLLMFATLINSDVFAREDDVVARGSLLTLSNTTVTVGTLTCNVDSSTEYRDVNDRPILASAFTIGERVKLKCRGGIAHELEKERSSSSPTPSATSTPNSQDDNRDRNHNGEDRSNSNRRDGERRGEDRRGGGREREIEFEKRFKKVTDVVTTAKGKIEYKLKLKKNETRGSLKISVKVPVPSTVPAVADQDAAGTLALKGVFSRLDSNSVQSSFAQCDFAFDRIVENEEGAIFAEYKVVLENKKGTVVVKKGSCDLDLVTDGVQSGIPELKRGDKVVVQDATPLAFLEAKL